MNCLTNILTGKEFIIGLKHFNDPLLSNPISSLFINDFSGISLKTASAVTSEEIGNGLDLIKEKITLATRLVLDDVKSKLEPLYNFNSIIESNTFGIISNAYYSALNGKRGIYIKRYTINRFSKIYIESVTINMNSSKTFDLRITDGNNDFLFKSITSIAGQSQLVPVNYMAENENVKIYIDNKGQSISYNKSLLTNFGNGGFRNHRHCSDCGATTKHLSAWGWNGNDFDKNCYGLTANVSLQCDESVLYCTILNRLYFVIWYQSGIEFLNEVITSKRLNPICQLSQVQAKELKLELEDKYNKKYDTIIQSVKDYLSNTKDVCINCNGVKYVQSIP